MHAFLHQDSAGHLIGTCNQSESNEDIDFQQQLFSLKLAQKITSFTWFGEASDIIMREILMLSRTKEICFSSCFSETISKILSALINVSRVTFEHCVLPTQLPSRQFEWVKISACVVSFNSKVKIFAHLIFLDLNGFNSLNFLFDCVTLVVLANLDKVSEKQSSALFRSIGSVSRMDFNDAIFGMDFLHYLLSSELSAISFNESFWSGGLEGAFPKNSSLKHISFSDTSVPQKELEEFLLSCHSLVSVDCSTAELSENLIKHFVSLTTLKSINLLSCKKVFSSKTYELAQLESVFLTEDQRTNTEVIGRLFPNATLYFI